MADRSSRLLFLVIALDYCSSRRLLFCVIVVLSDCCSRLSFYVDVLRACYSGSAAFKLVVKKPFPWNKMIDINYKGKINQLISE